MAEHGIAVKPPQPAKNSPAAACRSAGAGHCLVLAFDMSWLLVVMSACFYLLRSASKSVRRSAYGAPYRRICAAGRWDCPMGRYAQINRSGAVHRFEEGRIVSPARWWIPRTE
jgi:hypothetical protein